MKFIPPRTRGKYRSEDILDDEDRDGGESALLHGYSWKSDDPENSQMVQRQKRESIGRPQGGNRMHTDDSVTQKHHKNTALSLRKKRTKNSILSQHGQKRNCSGLKAHPEDADESKISIAGDDSLRGEYILEHQNDSIAAQLKAASYESEDMNREQTSERKESIEKHGDKKKSFQKLEERKSVRFSEREMIAEDNHGNDENNERPSVTTNKLWWSWWITIATAAISLTNFVLSWTSFDIIDEDDVVTMAALVKGVSSANLGIYSTAEVDAMAKIMAVSSAQNAVSSVATGKMVAVGGSTGAGGSALGSSGSGGNSATTTVVVVTAVAAATLAGVYVSETGQSLLCPNVASPDFFTGGMAIDFIWSEQRKLTTGEATPAATSVIETYNELFGCNSEFSRVLVNCSIPCERPTGPGLESPEICCDDVDDPFFWHDNPLFFRMCCTLQRLP